MHEPYVASGWRGQTPLKTRAHAMPATHNRRACVIHTSCTHTHTCKQHARAMREPFEHHARAMRDGCKQRDGRVTEARMLRANCVINMRMARPRPFKTQARVMRAPRMRPSRGCASEARPCVHHSRIARFMHESRVRCSHHTHAQCMARRCNTTAQDWRAHAA